MVNRKRKEKNAFLTRWGDKEKGRNMGPSAYLSKGLMGLSKEGKDTHPRMGPRGPSKVGKDRGPYAYPPTELRGLSPKVHLWVRCAELPVRRGR